MSSRTLKILHYIGNLFAVAGIVFVGFRLQAYWNQLDFSAFNASLLLILIALACVYGTANTLLALAWRNILNHLGANTALKWAMRIYGISQLAKYVPGNIMHLAGRQAMAQAAGVPGWTLAKSTAWELGLLVFTGFLYAPLVLPRFVPVIGPPVAIIVFLLTVCVASLVIKRKFGIVLVRAFGQHFFFLLFSGVIFFLILKHVESNNQISFFSIFFCCGSFIIAWLIGLITPGAPAGLGVREFILTALLHNFITEADLLLTVLLSRIVTAAGDMLFFLFVSIFLPKIKSGLSPSNDKTDSGPAMK